jgi:ribosome-binding protein aMBF1 (putative translation factor)
MQCDMCGKEDSNLKNALIENVEMQVCSSCIKYGKPLAKKKKPKSLSSDDKKKIFERVVNKREVIMLLVENFASKVKQAREQKGLFLGI